MDSHVLKTKLKYGWLVNDMVFFCGIAQVGTVIDLIFHWKNPKTPPNNPTKPQ